VKVIFYPIYLSELMVFWMRIIMRAAGFASWRFFQVIMSLGVTLRLRLRLWELAALLLIWRGLAVTCAMSASRASIREYSVLLASRKLVRKLVSSLTAMMSQFAHYLERACENKITAKQLASTADWEASYIKIYRGSQQGYGFALKRVHCVAYVFSRFSMSISLQFSFLLRSFFLVRLCKSVCEPGSSVWAYFRIVLH